LQEIVKLTQENLDASLKKLSKFAFDIDDESRAILGLVAKNGASTETKITKLGNRRIILSRDIIRRRLLVTDLSGDFFTVKKGKKIGNLKGKQEKFYSLTFKGILASLYETKLSENYWIKNYISNIEKITNKTIAELFLKHIHHCLIIHLILNSQTKGSLTNYKASQSDISDIYYSLGSLHNSVHTGHNVDGIPSQYKELFINSIIEFYVSCSTIPNLIYDLKLSPKFQTNRKGSESDRFIIIFFEDWFDSIFDVIGKTFENVFKEYPDHDSVRGEPIDFEEILGDSPTVKIEELSKKLYLKSNPKGKFERVQTLLSPRPTSSENLIENSYDD
jgi:hypothetical protein